MAWWEAVDAVDGRIVAGVERDNASVELEGPHDARGMGISGRDSWSVDLEVENSCENILRSFAKARVEGYRTKNAMGIATACALM